MDNHDASWEMASKESVFSVNTSNKYIFDESVLLKYDQEITFPTLSFYKFVSPGVAVGRAAASQ